MSASDPPWGRLYSVVSVQVTLTRKRHARCSSCSEQKEERYALEWTRQRRSRIPIPPNARRNRRIFISIFTGQGRFLETDECRNYVNDPRGWPVIRKPGLRKYGVTLEWFKVENIVVIRIQVAPGVRSQYGCLIPRIAAPPYLLRFTRTPQRRPLATS